MDDEAVIQLVRAGQVDAFRMVVQKYQRPIFRLIHGFFIDGHQCEDLAQEVFLTAYRKLAAFDPQKGKFSTWLYTLAKNTCLNALKCRRPIPVNAIPERIDGHRPDQVLMDREFLVQFDRYLQRLTNGERAVFVMVDLMDLSHEEVAEAEKIPLGTVRSRLCKAKGKLRQLMSPQKGTNYEHG